jgi:uncharacterized protein YqfA (UPF0365 family)
VSRLFQQHFYPMMILAGIGGVALLLVVDGVVLWGRARRAACRLPLTSVLRLRLTQRRAGAVVAACIRCRRAGVTVTLAEVEGLFLAAPERFDDEVRQLIAEQTGPRGGKRDS